MLKEVLQNIVNEKRKIGVPDFVIKNFLKEFLQYPVLTYIYNSKNYKNMIFTGGSCLRICFDLPRLSEDLDFDLLPSDYRKFKINELANDLKKHFKKDFLIDVVAKVQSDNRLYLKFPVLHELGIAETRESDELYVKVEPMQTQFSKPKMEVQAISQFGYNFIVRRYDLPFLMTGKLSAIFSRVWFSGKGNEVDIKGRDFYDLYWYLQKGVNPDFKNLQRLVRIKNNTQLKDALINRIEKDVTSKKLLYDLQNFFENQNFVKDFCKNYKEIVIRLLDTSV